MLEKRGKRKFAVVFPRQIAIGRCQNCGQWENNTGWACECESPNDCRKFETIAEAEEFIRASGWQWGHKELQPWIAQI